MINKELIKQRKEQYGSNFKDIEDKWNEYLQQNKGLEYLVTIMDVCNLMALMKTARIEAIELKIQELNELEKGSSRCTDRIYDKLQESLKDSIEDRSNYLWIANNFKEYEEM